MQRLNWIDFGVSRQVWSFLFQDFPLWVDLLSLLKGRENICFFRAVGVTCLMPSLLEYDGQYAGGASIVASPLKTGVDAHLQASCRSCNT